MTWYMTLILCVALLGGGILGCYWQGEVWSNLWHYIWVAVAVVCYFALFATIITSCVRVEKSVKDKKYDICSLTTNLTNQHISAGMFVLGVGVYQEKDDETIFYYFYKKERQGGWRIEKVFADDVLIYEDADKKPYYVVTNKYYKDYDELHLPKNTIRKDINKIDLTKIVKSKEE